VPGERGLQPAPLSFIKSDYCDTDFHRPREEASSAHGHKSADSIRGDTFTRQSRISHRGAAATYASAARRHRNDDLAHRVLKGRRSTLENQRAS
jgi:hypothetical protein